MSINSRGHDAKFSTIQSLWACLISPNIISPDSLFMLKSCEHCAISYPLLILFNILMLYDFKSFYFSVSIAFSFIMINGAYC